MTKLRINYSCSIKSVEYTSDSWFSHSQFSFNSQFSSIFAVYQTWCLLLNITQMSYITWFSHTFATDQNYD